MKFEVFSVVVGTDRCIACCPFCVSSTLISEDIEFHTPTVNWRNFDIALKLAKNSNIQTAMLTSYGEPTLHPDLITQYVRKLDRAGIPFIELQTNGMMLAKHFSDYLPHLYDWYEAGLTHICVSVVSHKEEVNQRIYQPRGSHYNLSELIANLHKIGFSVRLTAICANAEGFVNNEESAISFIEYAQKHKVEQVTLRPLNAEYRRESTKGWCEKHMLTDTQKSVINNLLLREGTILYDIPKVGMVFDFKGQNVMWSLPLNKYTKNTDSEHTRNLIFFPDGHIRYEWEKTGGILL